MITLRIVDACNSYWCMYELLMFEWITESVTNVWISTNLWFNGVCINHLYLYQLRCLSKSLVYVTMHHRFLREKQMIVMHGVILHKLDTQKYHTILRVKCYTIGFPMSGVWLHASQQFAFLFMVSIMSDLFLSWFVLLAWKSISHGQKTYHMVTCPNIPNHTYQMLYASKYCIMCMGCMDSRYQTLIT